MHLPISLLHVENAGSWQLAAGRQTQAGSWQLATGKRPASCQPANPTHAKPVQTLPHLPDAGRCWSLTLPGSFFLAPPHLFARAPVWPVALSRGLHAAVSIRTLSLARSQARSFGHTPRCRIIFFFSPPPCRIAYCPAISSPKKKKGPFVPRSSD